MKKVGLPILLMILCLPLLAVAQTEKNSYLNIDYLKVDSEDYAEFEDIVSNNWKKIYEQELSPEKLMGWYFYKVIYPGGQRGDFNYVIITTYKDPNTVVEVQDRLNREIKENEDGKMARALDLATHQFSELWKTEAGIYNENKKDLSEFVLMNYMMVSPGKEAEYLTLENDMARPLHVARVEEGKMHSWRTYSLLSPVGLDYRYNFVTADHFDEMNHTEFGFTNELIKSVMPGSDITEMFNAIYSTRDIMKSETWRLIDSL